jgi:hypothetical protein
MVKLTGIKIKKLLKYLRYLKLRGLFENQFGQKNRLLKNSFPIHFNPPHVLTLC